MMKKLYTDSARLFGTYAAGNVMQRALTILLIPVYTRYLGLEDYGALTLLSVTAALVDRFIIATSRTGVSRFYYNPAYESRRGELIFNMLLAILVFTALVALLYWVAIDSLNRLLFRDENMHAALKLYVWVLILTPLQSYLSSFVAFCKNAKIYVVSSCLMLVCWASTAVFLMAYKDMGIFAAIWGNIVGLAVVVIVCLPMFISRASFRLNIRVLREPILYAAPQAISGYADILFRSGDRYILNALCTLDAVGLYSFGYRMGAFINMFITSPAKLALSPIVFEQEHNPDLQREFIRRTATHFYAAGMFLVLGLSLFAREAIMLLARNESFWAAWKIVPLVAFSYLLHGMGDFLNWGLIMEKKSGRISANIVLATLANLAMNVALIPAMGIFGAALATLLSYVLWNLLKGLQSRKFWRLELEWGRLLGITGIAGVVLAAGLAGSIGISLPLSILLKGLALLAYVAVLPLTGCLSMQEVKAVKSLLLSRKGGQISKTEKHSD